MLDVNATKSFIVVVNITVGDDKDVGETLLEDVVACLSSEFYAIPVEMFEIDDDDEVPKDLGKMAFELRRLFERHGFPPEGPAFAMLMSAAEAVEKKKTPNACPVMQGPVEHSKHKKGVN